MTVITIETTVTGWPLGCRPLVCLSLYLCRLCVAAKFVIDDWIDHLKWWRSVLFLRSNVTKHARNPLLGHNWILELWLTQVILNIMNQLKIEMLCVLSFSFLSFSFWTPHHFSRQALTRRRDMSASAKWHCDLTSSGHIISKRNRRP